MAGTSHWLRRGDEANMMNEAKDEETWPVWGMALPDALIVMANSIIKCMQTTAVVWARVLLCDEKHGFLLLQEMLVWVSERGSW